MMSALSSATVLSSSESNPAAAWRGNSSSTSSAQRVWETGGEGVRRQAGAGAGVLG